MPYDLKFLSEFCREVGLDSHVTDTQSLEIPVGEGAVMCFQNADHEDDCLLGFLGTPWHTHGDYLTFADPRGNYIEVDILNLLSGLKAGQVLVCEEQIEGRVADRWLIHSEYNNELQHLRIGEGLRVRRAHALDRDAKPRD